MRKFLSGVAATAIVVATGGLMAFVGVNWVTGCESWDREQWTQEHSCVTPSDVIDGIGRMLVSPAAAEPAGYTSRDLRRERRESEARISPSWERRLRQSDREADRRERREYWERERKWDSITKTDDED
jgi:hypothetical protein